VLFVGTLVDDAVPLEDFKDLDLVGVAGQIGDIDGTVLLDLGLLGSLQQYVSILSYRAHSSLLTSASWSFLRFLSGFALAELDSGASWASKPPSLKKRSTSSCDMAAVVAEEDIV
jgi:hypothetical protein